MTHTIHHFPEGTIVKPRPDCDFRMGSSFCTHYVTCAHKDGFVTIKSVDANGDVQDIFITHISQLDIVKRGTGQVFGTELNRYKSKVIYYMVQHQHFTPMGKTHYVCYTDDSDELLGRLCKQAIGYGYKPSFIIPTLTVDKIVNHLRKLGICKPVVLGGVTYNAFNKKRIVKWVKQNINRVIETDKVFSTRGRYTPS